MRIVDRPMDALLKNALTVAPEEDALNALHQRLLAGEDVGEEYAEALSANCAHVVEQAEAAAKDMAAQWAESREMAEAIKRLLRGGS